MLKLNEHCGRMMFYMLKLVDIKKDYKIGDTTVSALKGVSVEFRKNEFVSILGPSGCGKTTLLNIIGGLDRYSSGDLVISGKSTKEFKDSNWDTYRNHTIGFVFQSYNLIPHQSVLANVELALTLSGVSREERRNRAKEALKRVGLGDQLNKRPNQMSGGQMQRVAIARALVNNPEILLADEPTGALDSETSVQIMDLLKEIASDRLVIMVTHNPELAEKYSTRIINLFDGVVTNDTAPYSSEDEEDNNIKQKKPSMSLLTAFSLSCNNLLTKKARTILTSVAGSIGIIGIALILSLSNGVQAYIDRVEEDTLSSYPITIEQAGTDVSELITSLMGENQESKNHGTDKIYSNDIMNQMMTTMINGISSNDLESFKKYIENDGKSIRDYTSDIKYSYSTQMNIYTADGYQVNPSKVFEEMGFNRMSQNNGDNNTNGMGMGSSSFSNAEVWQQLLDNKELLEKQYNVLSGRMPEKYNEVVVIVDEHNEISDYTLYTLGLKDSEELKKIMKKAMNGEKVEKSKQTSYSYDEITSLKFRLMVNSDFYKKNADGTWTDMHDDNIYMLDSLKKSEEISVVGILKADSDSASSAASGTVGYLSSLTTHLIDKINKSEIVKAQKDNEKIDVFSGKEFATDKEYTINDLNKYISTLPTEEQAKIKGYIAQMQAQGMNEKQIVEKFASYLKANQSDSTYEDNLSKLGVSDLNVPSRINIYPKDFEAKEKIGEIINDYNASAKENSQIKYTDYIGLMLSSVTTIINAISYILIAFVSISLVVSSIMIGIITYISVLERTKEIGILRAMGASKHDISRVFNAETLIIGFAAGIIGIGATLLLLIPINAIIKSITDIAGLAILPVKGAIALIIISMLLTFIAGLIPSKYAAKKDPVTALRTE